MPAFRIHEDKENALPKWHRIDRSNERKALRLVSDARLNANLGISRRLPPSKIVIETPLPARTPLDEDEEKNEVKDERGDVELRLDMSIDWTGAPEPALARDDEDDRMNDLLFSEPQYRTDIYRYLLQTEHRHRPHPFYMSKQSELNDDMRSILVDWLVSISDEYDFAPVTLYLAVSYVDRFLSKMSVVRTKFQLLGVAAMMIAAKYEEIHPPDVHEFSSLTKDTCTIKQILRMEELLLRVLSFDLTTPTVQTFIEEYSVQGRLSKETMNLAMLISELCLVESVTYLKFLPSELAASSIMLSQHTINENNVWRKELEELTEYSLDRLYPLMQMQNKVFEESPTKSLQAVRVKYTKTNFRNVSRLKPRQLL